ncbi:hypothetical protein [Lewinella cohaerens]|uniref:hypothetical protein n=1 Tax=Lewinella cohaerens TaxID=70995 RepID=UPI00039A8DA0|nr:hypothetical protein [Lewinella cohaerens]
MSKTPSKRLFALIKSLSGPEKRYFKVANRSDSGSKYWLLFNAIESQETFNEVLLQQEVYGKTPVQSRKYSELKAYLYDLLLKSLQQYDEQTSVDYQLKHLLMGIRSLHRRWLFDDCKYLLKRTKKIAQKYERFSVILEVLDWEKQLAYASVDVDYLDNNLALLQEEEQSCLAKMANIKIYQGLFYRLYLMVQKNTVRSQEGKHEVETLAKHPLLISEDQCLSFRAKILFYRIHSILHYQFRRMEAFYTSCKALIELMESEPSILKEDSTQYIAALSNLAASCGYEGAYQEMRDVLEKLRKVKPQTIDDQLKIHRQYYNNYFGLCINTGSFEEGLKVLKRHLQDVKKIDNSLFEHRSFYFQYFYIYFGVEDYDQALNYLNEWLNLPRSVDQQDLQHLARLLNLVVHFEVGNTILLTSLLRSTQRNLQKKGRYNAFEQLFIQCLKQANQLPAYREQQKVFKEYLKKLETQQLTARDRATLRFFDFESWLKSKATRTPFSEVIRAKNSLA